MYAISDVGDHIFTSLCKTHLSYGGFCKAWNLIRKQADLPTRKDGRRPRRHDIRHTFAVRARESAPDQRDRIARHMLAVSTYLGHSCISDTYWYQQACCARSL